MPLFRMIKTYKRKTDQGKWSKETMQNTITAVLEDKMEYLAAKTYSTPQTILERKVKLACENNNIV